MKNKLNEEIVSAIRSYLPPNENIVSFLTNLFFWGKESTYRRLRCEIPFTYEEITMIASKLDFSIDNIISLRNKDRVFFDYRLYEVGNAEDLYFEKMQQLTQFFVDVCKSDRSKNMFAGNYIPYSFSIYFPLLTKFNYYKWVHQTQDMAPDLKMSDMELPQKIKNYREAWIKDDRSSVEVDYIFDNNVFSSVIRDIHHFYKRGLINETEVGLLREELHILVNGMEQLAKNGVTVTGAKANIYLCPMDIPSTHSHFEYDNNVSCHIQIHGIDVLQTYSPEACLAQKEWIELLKRYSLLISGSGEMQRFRYFNEQRIHIDRMGTKDYK